MIAQVRIDEIAKDAVVEAVRDLAHDKRGLAGMLLNEPALDEHDTPAYDAECARLEAAIRLHLPPDQQ